MSIDYLHQPFEESFLEDIAIPIWKDTIYFE